ncbi:MAG TPA: phytoene dehydrogenase [Planctomycetaceae bacterium]|nr:phytoene dehydrogenase [Planctomycetaceae bacterium]
MVKTLKDAYDVIVVGSGLAGMTAANILGKTGHSVLLLERHYKLGGLATTFARTGGHLFDISLHGFPVGMVKSCRRYWNAEIADRIVQLRRIRFDNPQFSLETTFSREDFTRLLVEKFGVAEPTVVAFFDKARNMSHYDDQQLSTRELFDEFFPGREDVIRLLMEPITYANGSTLEDPALTYGIVFSNFMSKGVFTFQGGTDLLIRLMRRELEKNGVDVALSSPCERICIESRKVVGVLVGGAVGGVVDKGRLIRSKAVLSNANLKGTILQLAGEESFAPEFVAETKAVRLNNSSTQVYIALKPGEQLDGDRCGDLLFTSTAPAFRTELLLNRSITSRTYSFYYPSVRPDAPKQADRYYVVASTNANYHDWADLSPADYGASKRELMESTLDHLDRYVPNVREKTAHIEAATPVTFRRYTDHWGGASFGTKYEGLAVSRQLHQQIPGLFHSGSVGIIMSGWLGAVNYGVIAANDVDAFLLETR